MGYRRSSTRTSGTFWGKSPYADGLTYGMYGTDGDYNNSLTYMFGEMTDRFGFMVFTADRDQIEYEDGFDTDYDAEVAAESWIEQNASQYITASVASRDAMISNRVSTRYDYVLYGMRHAPIYRSEYNGGNLDGVAFYGPKDDIDNSIDIEIVGDDQIGYECEPITPMGHILDAFYADTWSDIPNAIGYEIDAQHFKECLDNELYLFERDGTWIKDTRILSASREPRSAKVHKTAKRKMTMKEKLALINEDKLDEEDDPINPFF